MSAPLHAPRPYQQRSDPTGSIGDWVEEAALVLMLFSALVIIAVTLVLFAIT